MKFKAKVYRDAIEELHNDYACSALDEVAGLSQGYSVRFSKLFRAEHYRDTWTFSNNDITGEKDQEYRPYEELGRRTREIALELAAHLEETGEMDKILKGK